MSMKLTQYDGRPAIRVRWHTREPQAGDHMNILEDRPDGSGKEIVCRMVLVQLLYSQPYERDANMTEEYWSYMEMSESDFHRMRQSAARNQALAETHDTLF